MKANPDSAMMWLGVAALGVLAVGAVVLATSKKAQAAPQPIPNPVPPNPNVPTGTQTMGSPVTSFVQGSPYTFSGPVTGGIIDPTTWANALVAAGWTKIAIIWFGPTAQPAGGVAVPGQPGALPANTSTNSLATGTWNMPTVPVPTALGVTAIAGSFPPTAPVAVAGGGATGPATPPPTGTPTQLLAAQTPYTFMGPSLPANNTDPNVLATNLKGLGWSNISILTLGTQGVTTNLPAIIASSIAQFTASMPSMPFYSATAIWTGNPNTPIGIAGASVAITGTFTPTQPPIAGPVA